MTQPHYIDREAVAKIIDPAAFMFSPGELDDKVYSASRAHAFDRADRILALIAAPMEAVSRIEADTSLQKVQTTPPDMEAVAWRVKDYADGWILFHNEAPARKSGEARNGALVQALAVIPTEGGEQSSGNTGELNTEGKTNDRP